MRGLVATIFSRRSLTSSGSPSCRGLQSTCPRLRCACVVPPWRVAKASVMESGAVWQRGAGARGSPRGDSASPGGAVNQAHLVLSAVALRDGQRQESVAHLLAAARLEPSERLAMTTSTVESRLVAYLLKYGERASIVEFLERTAVLKSTERDERVASDRGAETEQDAGAVSADTDSGRTMTTAFVFGSRFSVLGFRSGFGVLRSVLGSAGRESRTVN